jgi:sterol desaturase/sphingolipid hydroxylase (fatty acid hydroxylase superfamily)
MTPELIASLGENIDTAFFTIGGIIFIIEIAEAFFKGNLKGKKLLEMVASASTQIPYLLVEIFIMTGAYTLFYLFAYSNISWMMPITWWSIALAVMFADLTYYWEHRVAHQVRILWTQHAVHHSSRDFNMITGIRFGPLESVWSLVAHIPLLFIGLPPELIFFGILAVLAYQTWIHTETIGKLGILEMYINTPSHHRVHHGSDQKYLDKNYGGILIIWDRMFGSFQVEEETPRYGLTTDFDSQNPLKVWTSELPELGRDLKRAKSASDVAGYLFKGPGWRPKKQTPAE